MLMLPNSAWSNVKMELRLGVSLWSSPCGKRKRKPLRWRGQKLRTFIAPGSLLTQYRQCFVIWFFFQNPLESVTQVTKLHRPLWLHLLHLLHKLHRLNYTLQPFPEWRCAGAKAQPPAIATLEKPISTHQHQCSPSMATITTVTSTASLYQEHLRHQPARQVIGFGAWAQDLLLSWIRWLWHVMSAYGTHTRKHTHTHTQPQQHRSH